jgi:hypothetical protein
VRRSYRPLRARARRHGAPFVSGRAKDAKTSSHASLSVALATTLGRHFAADRVASFAEGWTG